MKVITLLILGTLLWGAEKLPLQDVDTGKSMQELQRTKTEGKRTVLCIVTPQEYWKAVFARLGLLEDKEVENTLNAIDGKALVWIADMNLGENNKMNYANIDTILKNTEVTSINENKETILTRNTSTELSNVIDLIKPILANSMGEVGKNITVIGINVNSDDGKQVYGVYDKCELKVRYKHHVFSFQSPIDAFFVSRVLPNGRLAHASWLFDPWTGEKIK